MRVSGNIEDGLEELRYNKIVIATDADVDGMHIRLLLMTFWLQFFPELVKSNHVYILQTPLFRVRNKKETIYCYSDQERVNAIAKLGPKPEITRFKGLGEISPDEFSNFIGKNIRLEPVLINQEEVIHNLLERYMGKNTPERQDFIIGKLRIEKNLPEDTVKEVVEQLRPPAGPGLLPLRETAPGQGQLADRPCLRPLLRLHPLPSSVLPCLRHRPVPDRPGQQRRADLRAVRRARC